MNNTYRIIDANANRVCEGLRVIEDWLRFVAENQELTAEVKAMRHTIRDTLRELDGKMLLKRAASTDVGLAVSQAETAPGKEQLLPANFKRVQEGLRVIEESLKLLQYPSLAKAVERCRFHTYTLEQLVQPLTAMAKKRQALATDLYGLTAREFSRGRSNVEMVRAMIDGGIRLIQYREKDLTPKEKLKECDTIRHLTREAGVTFIVNDHPDLALLVEADGIHLGQDDLDPVRVRRLVGPEPIIGLSTHSPQQGRAALTQQVDYIGVGPIFPTFTKKDVCPPVGLEYLDYAVENIPLPFVAIGGIKEHNLRQVLQRGAKLVALVTEITGAENIPQKIKTLRKIIQEERDKHEL